VLSLLVLRFPTCACDCSLSHCLRTLRFMLRRSFQYRNAWVLEGGQRLLEIGGVRKWAFVPSYPGGAIVVPPKKARRPLSVCSRGTIMV